MKIKTLIELIEANKLTVQYGYLSNALFVCYKETPIKLYNTDSFIFDDNEILEYSKDKDTSFRIQLKSFQYLLSSYDEKRNCDSYPTLTTDKEKWDENVFPLCFPNTEINFKEYENLLLIDDVHIKDMRIFENKNSEIAFHDYHICLYDYFVKTKSFVIPFNGEFPQKLLNLLKLKFPSIKPHNMNYCTYSLKNISLEDFAGVAKSISSIFSDFLDFEF